MLWYNFWPSTLRLVSMWLHPDPLRRLAASIAFNHMYRVFREEAALVDLFTLDILVAVVRSIGLEREEEGSGSGSGVEEAKKALEHLKRIVKAKQAQLQAENKGRVAVNHCNASFVMHSSNIGRAFILVSTGGNRTTVQYYALFTHHTYEILTRDTNIRSRTGPFK